jgi:hypothetical protein
MLNPGGSTLVSIRYDSLFRDLTHFALENINNPKKEESSSIVSDVMVSKNKKLEKKL